MTIHYSFDFRKTTRRPPLWTVGKCYDHLQLLEEFFCFVTGSSSKQFRDSNDFLYTNIILF